MLTFEAGKYANTKRPTYILVDRGTASAAEVLAAALRIHRMCTCTCTCTCSAHAVHMQCGSAHLGCRGRASVD